MTWNEEFTLDNVAREIAAGGKLRLEARDEDPGIDDWIGATMPIAYSELCASQGRYPRKLEFVDKQGIEVGNVHVETEYIWS